jgi:hypothetical protein
VGAGVVALGRGIFAARKRLGQAMKNSFGGKKLRGEAESSRLVREKDDYERVNKSRS